MNNITPTPEAPRVIIACRVMKPEIDALINGSPNIETRYLDSSLHETPDKMPALIQEQIEEASKYASQIVLGYGLCSNGTAGVKAPSQGLIIPRVHDCIALLMGSRQAYDTIFKERPGTYYLTPGWIEERKDPIGYMEHDYVPKLGREKAEWGNRMELEHYTHIVMINTGAMDVAPLRKIAKENARFLDKQYEEIDGTPDYFERIVSGPYPKDDFILLKHGETMEAEILIG